MSTAVVCHGTKEVTVGCKESGIKLSEPESTASTIANETKATEEAPALHSQDSKLRNEIGKIQGATGLFQESCEFGLSFICILLTYCCRSMLALDTYFTSIS